MVTLVQEDQKAIRWVEKCHFLLSQVLKFFVKMLCCVIPYSSCMIGFAYEQFTG